ncbi:hypothetical protein OKW23_001273, partial [Bacilli bacterium PM5-9]|nr:hypothetical protein [Bacilli bacterium PM5-9]
MHLNYIKHFTNIKDNNISFSNVSTQ